MPDPTELLNLEVGSFNQLIENVFWMGQTAGGKLWWRGQDKDWNLLPSVHRGSNPAAESFLAFNFTKRAPSRYDRCPDREDYPSWLFLMQHYGLHTRLLDWSMSPLVALFFALETFSPLEMTTRKEDTVLWGLNPVALNENQLGVRMIASAHAEPVLPIFVNAFRQPENQIPNFQRIAAIVTDELDTRQLLQQSMFTVHGSNEPLNRVPGHEKFLRKIVIKKEARFMCQMLMGTLGISRSTLFPDLDNLAKELNATGPARDAPPPSADPSATLGETPHGDSGAQLSIDSPAASQFRTKRFRLGRCPRASPPLKSAVVTKCRSRWQQRLNKYQPVA